MTTPQFDPRDADLFLLEALALAKAYCPEWGEGWNLPQPPYAGTLSNDPGLAQLFADLNGSGDPGLVLLKLFSQLADYLSGVVNGIPRKQQLALYQFLGMTPRTAQPASVPLCFSLAPTAKSVLIPAGQAALDTATQRIRFETDADLLVQQAVLDVAVTVRPMLDSYINVRATGARTATTDTTAALPNVSDVTTGHRVAHCFMMGDALLFEPDPSVTKITIALKGKQLSGKYFQQWFDTGLNKISATVTEERPDYCEVTIDRALTAVSATAWAVHLGLCAEAGWAMSPTDTVDSSPAARSPDPLYWLLAQPAAATPIANVLTGYLPSIESVQCAFTGVTTPQQAASNGMLIDIGNGGYPFGPAPDIDSAFYLRSDRVFSKPGAMVVLSFEVRDVSQPIDGIKTRWENWTKGAWRPIDMKSGSDQTNGLQNAGKVTFVCPSLDQQSVSGAKGYWIRLRVIKGNYQVSQTTNGVSYNTYRAPYIRSLSVAYTYDGPPTCFFCHNAFELQSLPSMPLTPYRPIPHEPLLPEPQGGDALYLGFAEQGFDTVIGGPLSLYFEVESEVERSGFELHWAYWSKDAWQALDVDDTTCAFARSGIVTLTVPGGAAGIAPHTRFSRQAYWIRVSTCPDRDVGLPGIFPNAVMARNLTTYTSEILGSSNAQPDQQFSMRHTPVWPDDLEIQVVEPEVMTVSTSMSTAASDATVARDWSLIDGFTLEPPDSRCYTLDSADGIVSFGDGYSGMIPPRGRKNVIAKRYRTTDGARGNVLAGALSVLRPSVAGIAAVTNPLAATGGVDEETIDAMALCAPALLRANGRIVTAADLESLATAASPRVRRARCVDAVNDQYGNPVSSSPIDVYVLPVSSEQPPWPSENLLSQVRTYLSSHCLEPLADRINMRLPVFQPIDVGMCLRTRALQNTWTVLAASLQAQISAFLHASFGGPDGTGWQFGESIRRVSLLRLLSQRDDIGLAQVVSLTINKAASDVDLSVGQLPQPGQIDVTLLPIENAS